MEFKSTYHSFNPFRAEFQHQYHQYGANSEIKRFRSSKGRIICLVQLVLSPVTIPLKIARKILRLAAAIFIMLGDLINFTSSRYFTNLRENGPNVLDRCGSLLFSPLNIVVGRVRLLLGLIHPEIAFSW